MRGVRGSLISINEPVKRCSSSLSSPSLRILECLAYVFDGVPSSFPGHVQKTLPMEVKAQIGTARMAGLDSFSKQPEKLLRESAGVQDEVGIGARLGGKLMHPESGLGRRVSLPSHSGCVEEIEVPDRGTESQSFRKQVSEPMLGIPEVSHLQPLEGCGLRTGPLSAVVSHHREPDREAPQIVGVECLEKSADKTLPVLADGSCG